MASLSVTSTAAADGNVYIDNGGTWATVRGATSGTAQPTAGSVNVYASTFTSASIGRIFVPFDTSALTTNAEITAATLTLNVATVHGSNGTLHVVQSSQASTSDLVDNDFDNLTLGTSGGSVAVSSTGSKVITLNATALGWISKTGFTKLAVIEDHDQSNTDPSGSDYRFSITMSEDGTPANRPTLAITYTLVSSGFFYISV